MRRAVAHLSRDVNLESFTRWSPNWSSKVSLSR